MEEWQAKYIKKNLPALIQITHFNTVVQATLQSEGLLSDEEVCNLEATKALNGRIIQSHVSYDILVGRKLAYEKLTKVLFENSQSGAAFLLLDGFKENGIRSSLTQCGIIIKHDGFGDTDILAYGSRFKLKEFFPNVDTESLRKIFYETLPEHIYYYKFIKNKEFELLKDTIPPEPTIYVPRFISNRIKLNEDVFKCSCSDIFVFKGMARHMLSELAKPNYTASSGDQLECVTSRFIYLDRDDDWETILQISNAPVHLITFEPSIETVSSKTKSTISYATSSSLSSRWEVNTSVEKEDESEFVLENTSGNSEILSNFCLNQSKIYITEEEFMEQNLTQQTKSKGVCICDTPGMGKTMLLGNLARSFVQRSPTNITAFFGLSQFVVGFPHHMPILDGQPLKALLYLLQYITPTIENANVLKALIEKNILNVYLFFDGFDEITALEAKWMKKLFNLLRINFHGINIYVTARPHMRHDLETSLKVVAYDILPFNEENQVVFLVNYWTQEFPNHNYTSMKSFAYHVLKTLKETLSANEKDITGIPLLCGLIASVYANEAEIYSSSDLIIEFRCRALSITEMYKQFIKTKLETTRKEATLSNIVSDQITNIDTKHLKLFHIWQAWKLLFPEKDFLGNLEEPHTKCFDITMILKAGIVQQSCKEDTMQMEFVHRTFAEYLIAEYLTEYILSSEMTDSMYDNLIRFTFGTVFEDYSNTYVIIHFINSLLQISSHTPIQPDHTQHQIRLFNESLPSTRLQYLLTNCCMNSWINILSLSKHILCSYPETVRRESDEYFTKENFVKIISTALLYGNKRCFKECFQLAKVFNTDLREICHMRFQKVEHVLTKEVQKMGFRSNLIDLLRINKWKKTSCSLLQIAVACAQYEAVELLIEKTKCKNQDLIATCVEYSYHEPFIHNRLSVLQLLLQTDKNLIDECPQILMFAPMHLKIVIELIKSGAPMKSTDPKCTDDTYTNCVTFAAFYMSPSDFHKLVQFLLTERQANFLFYDETGSNFTLSFITSKAGLLPQTFEMILNIPEVDINTVGKDGNNLAFHAVYGDNLTLLKLLVQRGINYNCTNAYQKTLLHAAADIGSRDIISYLITLDLNPNKCDINEIPPLLIAAKFSDLETVKHLVDHGASCLIRGIHGPNLLHYAASLGKLDIISYCVNLGLSVDNGVHVKSPIILAAIESHFLAVKLLVKLGADFNVTDQNEATILHTAAEKGNIELAEYCIELGMDPNVRTARGNTPIMWIFHGDTQEIKMVCTLTNLGADLTLTNNQGENILHLAVKKGSIEILKHCVEIGIDLNMKDKFDKTPIMYAERNIEQILILIDHQANIPLTIGNGSNYFYLAAEYGDEKLLHRCIKLGLDPNQQTTLGISPIMRAVASKNFFIVPALIEAGGDCAATGTLGRNILHIAAELKDLDMIKYCLKLGSDINQPDHQGYTPVIIAACMHDIPTVLYLIGAGADRNAVSNDGWNILHIFAEFKDLDMVKFCLELGLDISQPVHTGNTPLFMAAIQNDVPTFRYLIEKGADYNQKNLLGQDVIHIALNMQYIDLLQYLKSLGWDPNQINRYGESRIFALARNGWLAKFKLFVEIGADCRITNNFDENLLHVAARTNNVKLICYLLKLGLSVNQQNVNGSTPIMMAALFGDIHSVWTLMESGADYKHTNKNKQTIFHHATRRSNEKLVLFCLYIGMDCNQGDIYGNTPFLLAARFCSTTLFQQMINCGADPTIMNSDNQTILHIAVRAANCQLNELCIQLGLDPNQKDKNGDSPIFLAAKYADIQTVLNLIFHGADLHSTNSQEQSLLHIAAERGNVGLVNYCLCQGLNPNQKDNNGDTPLFLAAECGDVETVHMLISYGADYYSVNQFGQNILEVAADWLNENLVSYCLNVLFIGKDDFETSPFKILKPSFRQPNDKKLKVVLKCQHNH